MKHAGIFTVSLDFELHWGGFEKWQIPAYRSYFLRTRQVIPEILNSFEAHGIHATWAAVGFLLFRDRVTLMKYLPPHKPTYTNSLLSAYRFIEDHGIGTDEKEDPFHFAGSLVDRILKTRGQELGSHTFSHYYCNEAGQETEQFRADLRSAQAAASMYGIRLSSLVFPRNQFNTAYLRVCHEEGFVAVRDNPRDWFWHIGSTENESLWKRLNRGLDAYLPLGKHNSYRIQGLRLTEGLPVCLPASRLLRPYDPRFGIINRLKVRRIRLGMESAAKSGEAYHLWWHPHNFGMHPSECMAELNEILDHYVMCRDRYGMESLSMGEIAARISRG